MVTLIYSIILLYSKTFCDLNPCKKESQIHERKICVNIVWFDYVTEQYKLEKKLYSSRRTHNLSLH